MKNRLIALLELDPKSTDDQILAAVIELTKRPRLPTVRETARETAREKEIQRRMSLAPGRLSREQASAVVDHQFREDTARGITRK